MYIYIYVRYLQFRFLKWGLICIIIDIYVGKTMISLGMVYTTYLWLFGGWFIIVLPTFYMIEKEHPTNIFINDGSFLSSLCCYVCMCMYICVYTCIYIYTYTLAYVLMQM